MTVKCAVMRTHRIAPARHTPQHLFDSASKRGVRGWITRFAIPIDMRIFSCPSRSDGSPVESCTISLVTARANAHAAKAVLYCAAPMVPGTSLSPFASIPYLHVKLASVSGSVVVTNETGSDAADGASTMTLTIVGAGVVVRGVVGPFTFAGVIPASSPEPDPTTLEA